MQPVPVSSRKGIGGPKTVEGKMRSSRNAVKHGLTSTDPVILELETLEAWDAFKSLFVESLHPGTPAEEYLAEEIALTLWRQRRIPIYEAALASARVDVAEARWEEYAHRYPEETEEHLTEVLRSSRTRALFRADDEAHHLIRYEAHLDRKLTRLFREYHLLQKHRNCETNSTSPSRAPENETPVTQDHLTSPRELPSSVNHPSQNCETNSQAQRPPWNHENEEHFPASETQAQVVIPEPPARVRSLQHPTRTGPLWSPWSRVPGCPMGDGWRQLAGGSLCPFTPARSASARP